MKQMKKIDKKLNSRVAGYTALMNQKGVVVREGQYTRPGSRNRKKR